MALVAGLYKRPERQPTAPDPADLEAEKRRHEKEEAKRKAKLEKEQAKEKMRLEEEERRRKVIQNKNRPKRAPFNFELVTIFSAIGE